MTDENSQPSIESLLIPHLYDSDHLYMISVPKGWEDIVRELHHQVVALLPDYKLLQVKEKFAGLRFYLLLPTDLDSSISDQIHQCIRKAENKSYDICMTCGQPGKEYGKFWRYVACEQHVDSKDVDSP